MAVFFPPQQDNTRWKTEKANKMDISLGAGGRGGLGCVREGAVEV